LTELFLKSTLGDDLYREVVRLAKQHGTAVNVVRTATRQFLAAAKEVPPTNTQEPPAAPRLSQHSREGPETSAHPDAEPDSFSFQGCSFILGGASLQILDDNGGEVTFPISAAVAFLLYLRRPLTVAILELLLSPEDFADSQPLAPE
jgi:hypothetical protein